MTVICTGPRASFCAAHSPPKPAPTITTRCLLLPFIVLLYKIHRDGIGFHKFESRAESTLGAMDSSLRCRPDFHCAAQPSLLFQSFVAVAGRCRNRLAHSHRATDPRNSRRAAHGPVLVLHGGPTLVCVGMAL